MPGPVLRSHLPPFFFLFNHFELTFVCGIRQGPIPLSCTICIILGIISYMKTSLFLIDLFKFFNKIWKIKIAAMHFPATNHLVPPSWGHGFIHPTQWWQYHGASPTCNTMQPSWPTSHVQAAPTGRLCTEFILCQPHFFFMCLSQLSSYGHSLLRHLPHHSEQNQARVLHSTSKILFLFQFHASVLQYAVQGQAMC